MLERLPTPGLGLCHFLGILQGKIIAAIALSYLANERGMYFTTPNTEVQKILEWAEEDTVKIFIQFIKLTSNMLVYWFSRHNQIISREWTLHQDICNTLWKLPSVSFCYKTELKLPNFTSPFQNAGAIAMDVFLYNWNHCPPSFTSCQESA